VTTTPSQQSPDDARRLQLLIDAVVDYAIYMIDLDGRILSWNSGAQRLKGYQPAEIIGQHFSRFFTPEDLQKELPQAALAAVVKTGKFETEGWRVRKDGTRFWALVVIDAVRDETGELIGFAKITRDMTERQVAQQRLLNSERRFRLLVEAVVDYSIFQLDPQGFIATWNAGAQRIKGYAAHEVIGSHFSCFYTQEDQEVGLPAKALRAAKERGKYEAEGWRVRKGGTQFWASVVIDPIWGDDQELLGFAKVTRDITERMQAQLALKATQEQLAAAQKMEAVGQLSGGIAHDFNNLMMIVLGNLETAQRNATQENPTLQRSITNAMRGAQRASALTSRLLAFSRRQPLNPKRIDVNQFLRGSVEFLQRSLGERISIDAIEQAGLWDIEADPNHLEAALVNLAINSRDAMPDGGKLTIEAANVTVDREAQRLDPELVAGEYVVVCFEDTGVGMSPDVLSHVFEPFFTTKEVGQGTGLGLSQVYGFVKQSGGHVKVESGLGKGTTVKIYLPRHVSVDVTSDADLTALPAGSQHYETILVVEDNEEVRSYVSEVLRELNYRVLTASDGRRALELLERQNVHIDLMLTDVVMPGMTGGELAQRAKALRSTISILHMTGYSRDELMKEGRLSEGIELLQKPISQSQLAVRVHDMLAGSRRRIH
jgi:PAS domain S-box-containing protein